MAAWAAAEYGVRARNADHPAAVAGSRPANGPALRAGITWSVPNSAAGKSSRW